jgi:hypothetical protein
MEVVGLSYDDQHHFFMQIYFVVSCLMHSYANFEMCIATL